VICEEKQRLLEAYQQVTAQYAAAVNELHRKMGTLSRMQYASLYGTTETLHAEVTRAQADLNTHVVAHRC
jgi:hypothetical protein